MATTPKLATLRRRPLIAAAIALGVATGALVPAGALFAQAPSSSKNQPMTPPTPPTSNSTPPAPWSQWLLAVGLVVLVVGVNCIPSKRGHQD